MVSAPIGALLYPQLVPGPLIFLAGVLALLTVLRERFAIVWPVLPAALTGRALGTVIAAVFMTELDKHHLGIIFAILILLAVLMTAMRWSFPSTRTSWGIAGIFSGVMGTLTSAGAPPLVMVAQHMPPPAMRATMSMVFLMGTAMALGTLVFLGEFTREQWMLSVTMLLPMWLGFMVSSQLVPHCSKVLTRRLLLGLTSISAVVLLLHSIG